MSDPDRYKSRGRKERTPEQLKVLEMAREKARLVIAERTKIKREMTDPPPTVSPPSEAEPEAESEPEPPTHPPEPPAEFPAEDSAPEHEPPAELPVGIDDMFHVYGYSVRINSTSSENRTSPKFV